MLGVNVDAKCKMSQDLRIFFSPNSVFTQEISAALNANASTAKTRQGLRNSLTKEEK